MTTSTNFREAFLQLEWINNKLQSNEVIDIEKIVSMQEEAKKLYDYCNKLLLKTEKKLDIDK